MSRSLVGGRTNIKRDESTVAATPTLGGFYKPKKSNRSKMTKMTKRSKTYSRKNKKYRTMKK